MNRIYWDVDRISIERKSVEHFAEEVWKRRISLFYM